MMQSERYLSHSNSLEEVRESRGWIIGLGIACSVLGLIMLASAVTTSFLTVGFLGVLLLIGGLVMAIHSFWIRKWSGFFLSLITGIFLVVSGLFILSHPLISLATLTLLLASYLVASGVLKTVFSLMTRFHNWSWMFFSGLLSIVLGAMIWSQWPASSLIVFGILIGVDLLMIGVTWTIIGASLGRIDRHHPAF